MADFELDVKSAESIITEAQSAGVFDAPMPEDEASRIKEAKRILKNCITARDAGSRNGVMQTLLGLAGLPTTKNDAEDGRVKAQAAAERNGIPDHDPSDTEGGEPVPEPEPESEAPVAEPPKEEEPEDTKPEEPPVDEAPSGGPEEEYQKTSGWEEQVKAHNLPVPPDYEGTPPEMPMDVEQLSDLKVRQLHMAFGACAARASFMASQEEARAHAAKIVADSREEDLLRKADKVDPETDKPKLQKVLEAEIATDPKLEKFRGRQATHERDAKRWRKLGETYDRMADRLSREWTMRTDAREAN